METQDIEPDRSKTIPISILDGARRNYPREFEYVLVAIFLAVLTINFIGDGLRDALDPRRVL